MAIAAYRLKHCGWTPDDAIDEMAKYGYDSANDKDKAILLNEYVEHLRGSSNP